MASKQYEDFMAMIPGQDVDANDPVEVVRCSAWHDRRARLARRPRCQVDLYARERRFGSHRAPRARRCLRLDIQFQPYLVHFS